MQVLIACEFSATVRDAFNAAGHDAWSCDLIPTEGRQGNHLIGDVRWAIEGSLHKYKDAYDIRTGSQPLIKKWDLMIAHPPCTYLTIAAEWAYGEPPYHQKVKPDTLVGEARRKAREEAISFFMELWNAPIPKIAIENPIGVMNSKVDSLPEPQIIQPWAFGDDASKATCLWLKGLPELKLTRCLAPRLGKGGRPVWGNQTATGQNRLSPSETRAAERAKTWPGIAKAMAEQWKH